MPMGLEIVSVITAVISAAKDLRDWLKNEPDSDPVLKEPPAYTRFPPKSEIDPTETAKQAGFEAGFAAAESALRDRLKTVLPEVSEDEIAQMTNHLLLSGVSDVPALSENEETDPGSASFLEDVEVFDFNQDDVL